MQRHFDFHHYLNIFLLNLLFGRLYLGRNLIFQYKQSLEKRKKDKIAAISDPDELFNILSEEKNIMYKKLLHSFEEKQ